MKFTPQLLLLKRTTLNLFVILLGVFFILGSGGTPVITILGDNPATVLQGSVYVDEGATAKDDDGPRQVSTTGLPIDTSVLGEHIVTYSVYGGNAELIKAERIVNVIAVVTDTTPPVITISGDNPATVKQGETYTDAGATAVDAVDGNVTVTTSGTVDTSTAGSYTITYTASDSKGNEVTATREVIVVDTTPPVITIIGNNPATVMQGETYTDAGATAVDNVDGSVTVTASGTVDTSTAGTYIITYTASDSKGNEATTTRVVKVPPKLNDTGITKCVNDTQNNLDCPVSTHPNQDAQFGRDATHNDDSDGHAGFSFTKISSTGAELPASATEWSCVKDNVTGLIWEVKTNDGGLHDKYNSYTWYNPDNSTNGGDAGTEYGDNDTDSFVINTNTAGWCGAHDWRMPTREELRSIVDYSIASPGPTIDTGYFPNATSEAVWSSSSYAGKSSLVWEINFYNGDPDGLFKDSDRQKVRLVRSRQ